MQAHTLATMHTNQELQAVYDTTTIPPRGAVCVCRPSRVRLIKCVDWYDVWYGIGYVVYSCKCPVCSRETATLVGVLGETIAGAARGITFFPLRPVPFVVVPGTLSSAFFSCGCSTVGARVLVGSTFADVVIIAADRLLYNRCAVQSASGAYCGVPCDGSLLRLLTFACPFVLDVVLLLPSCDTQQDHAEEFSSV